MFELPPPPPPRDDKPEDDFFVVVEQMPQLRGGLGALQRKVSYPEMARRAGIEGRVTVQFIVNEQGRVENPRVIRGIGGGCDEEALKAVKVLDSRQVCREVDQFAFSIVCLLYSGCRIKFLTNPKRIRINNKYTNSSIGGFFTISIN